MGAQPWAQPSPKRFFIRLRVLAAFMGKTRATSAAAVTLYTCICCEGTGKVVVIGICPLCDGFGHFADGDPVLAAPKLSSKAAKARAKDISQTLSMLLRHQARQRGVSIDGQGW